MLFLSSLTSPLTGPQSGFRSKLLRLPPPTYSITTCKSETGHLSHTHYHLTYLPLTTTPTPSQPHPPPHTHITLSHVSPHTTYLHFYLVANQAVSHGEVLDQVGMVESTLLVAIKLLLDAGNLFQPVCACVYACARMCGVCV